MSWCTILSSIERTHIKFYKIIAALEKGAPTVMQWFLCLIIPQFALIFSPFDLSMAVLCEMSSLCLKRPYSYTWTNVLSISMTSLRSILYWLCLYIHLLLLCIESTVYIVQFIHDLSSTYSFSQLPGVKGGAYWKFETQINVHLGAKPVMSHSHVSLPAEERPVLHRREGIFGWAN
jgi:hypothetical protein